MFFLSRNCRLLGVVIFFRPCFPDWVAYCILHHISTRYVSILAQELIYGQICIKVSWSWSWISLKRVRYTALQLSLFLFCLASLKPFSLQQ